VNGFALSIGAAALFGGYLVGVKRFFSHYPSTLFVMLTYVFAIGWYLPLMTLIGPVHLLQLEVGIRGNAVLLATGIFTAIAHYVFYRALALGDVSYVTPISKIVPVFVLPLEFILLQQSLSWIQITGALIATAAVYVANYQHGSLLTPFERLARSKAALLALLSAAAFGVVDIGKRVSMQELGVQPSSFVLIMLILVPCLLMPGAFNNRHAVDWWADRHLLAIAGLTLLAGQYLVATAFETLPASIVSPIVNTQAVIAVLLGNLLLDESQLRTRLAASGLAVLGVVLISAG
jgi:drug/metabolite transporter (DMT)-like permease